MRRLTVVNAGLILLMGALFASAQQAPEPETTPDTERPAIRVLAHPYDLASFYRSDAGSAPGDVRTNPHAIAGFYRSQSSPSYRPFAAYWSSGERYWGDPLRLGPRQTMLQQQGQRRRAPRAPAEPDPDREPY